MLEDVSPQVNERLQIDVFVGQLSAESSYALSITEEDIKQMEQGGSKTVELLPGERLTPAKVTEAFGVTAQSIELLE